jgi:hypothetical protein
MMTRAAALTLALSLLASSAFAGTATQTFMVGAVVVRSATVTAVVSATAKDGVHVQQAASRGTPAPMLLVAGGLKPMPQTGAVQVFPGSSDNMTVTIVY